MKTHDNRKPFQCTICNRGYNTAAALTSHMQNHKKQQQQQQHHLLMGATTTIAGDRPQSAYSYSPRSNGSHSSGAKSAAGSVKRKYAPYHVSRADSNNNNTASAKPEDTNNNNSVSCAAELMPLLDSRHSESTPSPSRLMAPYLHADPNFLKNLNNRVCLYCNKADFQTMDQLFGHIQAKHYGLIFSHFKFPQLMNFDLGHREGSAELKSQLGTDERQQPVAAAVTKAEGGIKREMDYSPNMEADEEEPETAGPTDLSQAKRPSAADDHQLKYLCNQCNAGLPDFESFRMHLKNHLSAAAAAAAATTTSTTIAKESHGCAQCPQTFASKPELEAHLVGHFKVEAVEYVCAVANCLRFGSLEELQKHNVDCHMQIVYKCSICADTFDSQRALEAHFNTATGHHRELNVLRCTSCVELFRNAKDFAHHVHVAHMNRGRIQCRFCPVTCASDLEMHFHLSSHTRQFQ